MTNLYTVALRELAEAQRLLCDVALDTTAASRLATARQVLDTLLAASVLALRAANATPADSAHAGIASLQQTITHVRQVVAQAEHAAAIERACQLGGEA